MKILTLGNVPKSTYQGISNIEFVETPEEADFVILSNGLSSYFLGTQLGELVERSYNLEFKSGKPSVLTVNQFLANHTPSIHAGI